MANEMVKFHNDLNTANMRKWTTEEMNFFFAFVAKAKGKGTSLIVMNKEEVVRMAGWQRRDDVRLKDLTERLGNNLLTLLYKERTKNSYAVMALFQWFKIEWQGNDFTVEMQVSEKFEYILNQLNANFTAFELEEFVGLRSTYAKQAYRMIKQFRTSGWWQIQVEQFRELFNVPKSYRATDINRRILKPIQQELAPYFPGLKAMPIKKPAKGSPVIAYRFEWNPEASNGPYEPGKPKRKRKLKQTEVAPLPGWYAETGETGPTDDLLAEIEEVRKQNKKAEE